MEKRTIFLSARITSALIVISLGLLTNNSALAQAANAPSPTSPSSYLDADYVSFFSGNFIKAQGASALDQLFKNLNFSVDHFSLSPSVILNQIQVQIVPKTYEIIDTSTGIAFQSTGNAVNFNLGSVSVNETIQETGGGGIGTITIQASCQGVNIQISDPNSLISGELSPVQAGDLVNITLSNPVVSLGTPQVQFSAIQCTGAQGFEKVISDAVQSAMKDPNVLSQLIQTNVVTAIEQKMKQAAYNWTSPQMIFSAPYNNGPGMITAWIFPAQLKSLSGGSWQSKGTLRFTLPYNSSTPAPHFPLASVDFTSFANQNVFILPEAAVTALVQAYFAPGEWSLTSLANSISAFAYLLRSRFLQFFLWCDLMHWPKSTQFPLVSSTSQVASMNWNPDGSMALQTTLKIEMSAGSMPYLHFQVPLKADLGFTVANNQLTFKPANAQIKINYQYDKAYCAGGHGRCGRIASTLIKDAVQSYLDKDTFQLPLPVMEIVGGASVQATNLQHEPNLKSFVITFGNPMAPGP